MGFPPEAREGATKLLTDAVKQGAAALNEPLEFILPDMDNEGPAGITVYFCCIIDDMLNKYNF